MATSTLRFLVDKELETRDTTLSQFIEDGRAEGKSVCTLTEDLAYLTGIPISWRTLYRWVERSQVSGCRFFLMVMQDSSLML